MLHYGKLGQILRENPCEFVHKKSSECPDGRVYFTLEEMDYIKKLLQTANIILVRFFYFNYINLNLLLIKQRASIDIHYKL